MGELPGAAGADLRVRSAAQPDCDFRFHECGHDALWRDSRLFHHLFRAGRAALSTAVTRVPSGLHVKAWRARIEGCLPMSTPGPARRLIQPDRNPPRPRAIAL